LKVFHFKHREIFVSETAFNEEQFIEQYNDFFEQLLRCKNISQMKIFQLVNLTNYTISNRPVKTEPFLKKRVLPAFKFLTCSN
jgi:hypothetical protein